MATIREREHLFIKTEKEKHNAVDLMESTGALFKVNYPPARFWQEGDLGWVDEYPMPLHQEGKHKDTPLHKWVVREDTGDVLGLHGGTYPENESYLYLGEMAEQMFPESTVGCRIIGKGERLMLTQDIGEPVDLGEGDLIKPQILWITSMNASWSTAVMDSMYRWFCSNQIVMGSALFSCRHTENHNYTLQQRSWVLEESMRRAQNFAAMARVMKDQEYTDEQFKELTKQLVPDPKPLPGDTEVKQVRWTLVYKKRDHLGNKWNEECEQWSPNRWTAYNAVQGCEQHHINSGFKETDAAVEKSLIKAVNGKTPLADKALSILSGISG